MASNCLSYFCKTPKHIGFRGEVAHSVRQSLKGQITIEILGLNRGILNNVRLCHLQKMKIFYNFVQLAASRLDDHDLQLLAQQADKELKKAVLDSAEYAAVTRQAIKDKFQGILDS
jgi:hypothetical protein